MIWLWGAGVRLLTSALANLTTLNQHATDLLLINLAWTCPGTLYPWKRTFILSEATALMHIRKWTKQLVHYF